MTNTSLRTQPEGTRHRTNPTRIAALLLDRIAVDLSWLLDASALNEAVLQWSAQPLLRLRDRITEWSLAQHRKQPQLQVWRDLPVDVPAHVTEEEQAVLKLYRRADEHLQRHIWDLLRSSDLRQSWDEQERPTA